MVEELGSSGVALPSLGRIVLYESKNGDGILSPAVVLRTRATTDPAIIERWGPDPDGTLSGNGRPEGLVAELPTDLHVDLLVHGLGGDYREYNVPHPSVDTDKGWPTDDPSEKSETARTWTWPPRV